MFVQRIGFTPVKGGRHLPHDVVDLRSDGPAGDRVFCLVDRSRARVLRTVENPSLLQGSARWDAGTLSVELNGRIVEGIPTPSGETFTFDYWGRSARLEGCSGPWAQAYSEHLGRDTVLCRCVSAGEVVYGASVTIVTTASMSRLAERLGRTVGSERFRATFLVDTEKSTAHLEDSWIGQELQLGEATVRVREPVPRCAVIDLDPVTGKRDVPILRELAGYRRDHGEISFGVDAVVTAAGQVRTGDAVVLRQGG